jgi:dihydrofolate reductase
MTRQALAAGLLDEVDVDLVPIVLSEGVRLFETQEKPAQLELQRVVDAPGVTHLSYRVVEL